MTKPSYTGIVLNPDSRVKLISLLQNKINDDGWEIIAHHMTCNLGAASQGPAEIYLGEEVYVKATHFAKNQFVAAVQVESRIPSTNTIKHITLSVNRQGGGKPFMSNQLINWEPLESDILLKGIVAECDAQGNVISS